MTGSETFGEALLPVAPQTVAPDGSLVRILVATRSGSMAHFELGPGETSTPKRHRTVSEIWYVLGGHGRMWRQNDAEPGRVIDLRPGVALTIPVGTAFQFTNTGREPLSAVGVTIPPWPDTGDEAIDADGPWPPCLAEPPGPLRQTR